MQACFELKISATSQMHRYLRGLSLPGAEILSAVGEKGFNINWLLLGEGPMFAATPAGEELKVRIAQRIVKKEVTIAVDEDLMTKDLQVQIDAERAQIGEFTDTGALLPKHKDIPMRPRAGGTKRVKE